MLHGDEFGEPDWILMLLAPPVVGAAIGLLVSLWRRSAGMAALGGAVGGTLGAWLAVAIYRWVVDQFIGGRDINIFSIIMFSCFFLGSIPLAWFASGPEMPLSAGQPRIARTGCGFLLACGFVVLIGVLLYGVACEPSAFMPIDESVKYLAIAFILGGAATLAGGLAWTRRSR